MTGLSEQLFEARTAPALWLEVVVPYDFAIWTGSMFVDCWFCVVGLIKLCLCVPLLCMCY